jgi:hypothetical protein
MGVELIRSTQSGPAGEVLKWLSAKEITIVAVIIPVGPALAIGVG